MQLDLAANAVGIDLQNKPDKDFYYQGVFWIKPYIQLGENWPRSIEIIWFSHIASKHWSVEFSPNSTGGHKWCLAPKVYSKNIKLLNLSLKKLRVTIPIEGLDELGQDNKLNYRICLNLCPVFTNTIVLPSSKTTNGSRICLFGDYATKNKQTAFTAQAVKAADPALVILLGDLVYNSGYISEYREKFFPFINAGKSDLGAGLISSRLFVPVIGNHDISLPSAHLPTAANLNDSFGYFELWQPSKSNLRWRQKNLVRMLLLHEQSRALLKRFKAKFLSKTNYSFDFLNTHWVVLDANKYMDWSLPALRDWLASDLASSKAKWKFVCFHQPGFNSDPVYSSDQRMRIIYDVLTNAQVDMVFSGHCHFYERHKPFNFQRFPDARTDKSGLIDGNFEIDNDYDGITNICFPKGIINIISGAGGRLLTPNLRVPENGRILTSCKLVDDKYSFSVLDLEETKLTFTQLSTEGEVLDKIMIQK